MIDSVCYLSWKITKRCENSFCGLEIELRKTLLFKGTVIDKKNFQITLDKEKYISNTASNFFLKKSHNFDRKTTL